MNINNLKFKSKFTKLEIKSHLKCNHLLKPQRKIKNHPVKFKPNTNKEILYLKSTVKKLTNWDNNILKILNQIHQMTLHHIKF